jgi:tRNA threonylcarbamoyl adenosine modification protein YeaZ/ribosomal-protein-alanine acetyltransferase
VSTFLSIDTSTARTSVAIVKDDKTLFESHHDGALSHGEVLPKLVAEGLKIESNIDQVVVGMGPGPFTGLRVGIAFAQSFALARGIPWSGVCSLDAIASQFADNDFLVAIDARRKEVFYARYTNGSRIGEPKVCQPSQLVAFDIPIYGEERNQFPDPKSLDAIAVSGATYLQPIYVRRPDAYPAPVGVKFRPMNQLDLVPAFAIEKESYGHEAWTMAQFKEEFAGKERMYVAAEFAGELIAYAGVVNLAGTADVLTVTVAAGHRRKGIGRELLRRLIDWSRTQKCEAIMLEVRVGNEEAIPLYESFGFIEISRRKDYYGPGKPAIVMRKELM